MSLRCPGYLNAKSLLDGGDCLEDYVEWFSSPELSSCRLLIDTVYRTMQYRGDEPVLLVCDVSSESCLIFRFTMKAQDRKGRNHQRCEVMKVEHSELPALLNGEFTAVPDENTKEFVVDGVEGTPLPQCEHRQVKDVMFGVYARNPKAYWFKSEGVTQIAPPSPLPTGVSRQPIRAGKNVDYPKQEKKIVNKVLFALLTVSCVFGVWNYFQSADEIECLRKNLEARERDVKGCRSEISTLRNENERLEAEINKFDKWVKARSNFELNKAQLKVKFDEIIQDFREAENLLSHIDETPKLTSMEGRLAVSSSTSDVNSRTNNVSQTDISLPQRECGSRGESMTESSKLRKHKREDKEKEEKGVLETPPEKIKALF